MQKSLKIWSNTFIQEMYNRPRTYPRQTSLALCARWDQTASLSDNLDMLHKVILRIRDNYICLICGWVSISLFQPTISAPHPSPRGVAHSTPGRVQHKLYVYMLQNQVHIQQSLLCDRESLPFGHIAIDIRYLGKPRDFTEFLDLLSLVDLIK